MEEDNHRLAVISTLHPVPFASRPARRRGFTLLELCIVLFIIALMAAAAVPSMVSAFTEQALRGDAHQLSIMVKTAMIKSGEQQRPYLISYQGKELLLEPAPSSATGENADMPSGPVAASAPLVGNGDDEAEAVPAPEDVTQTQTLSDVLKFPDAARKNAWETLPSVNWTFEPAHLCPLPRVRLERGDAYIEMSFNALTGDVEDEAFYIP